MKFEHWLKGKCEIVEIEAETVEEAVIKLSKKYKGVFRRDYPGSILSLITRA